MKRTTLSILLLGFLLTANAQIRVATNNNVGIGTSNPISKLSVNSDGYSGYLSSFYTTGLDRAGRFDLDYPSSSTYNIALLGAVSNIPVGNGNKNIAGYFSAYSSTTHSKRSFGVHGKAGNGASGYNYGVMGILMGSRGGAGIVGTVGTEPVVSSGQYAGFFYGNVKVTGTLWTYDCIETSDERLKTNIRQISSSASEKNHVNNLLTLSAIKYNLRSPAEYADYSQSDTLTVEDFEPEHMREYYTRERIGLSAQEIQAVYPELVVEDSEGYLGVDYNGLIPVLIEATKEQQAVIEELQTEISRMKTELDRLRIIK
jgi:hypothetical protein